MKKAVAIAALSVTLVGCQSTGTIWHSTSNQDAFTDKVTKMVTIGEGTSPLIITQSLRYYPFVGTTDGALFVGLRSGGRFRIPAGTVQLRVDDKPAWTIGPDETPLALVPKMPTMPVMDKQMDPSGVVAQTQAGAIDMVMKMASPYTAATGQKAKDIVKQMLNGRVVKYRTVGANQAASTTGEVQIDASFAKSLLEIGITPESLN